MTSNGLRERTNEALAALLAASFGAWSAAATVTRRSDGACVVVLPERTQILIARAPQGLPFRWCMTVDGRQRMASSINGLLRLLHVEIDPSFQPARARIAGLPPGPPPATNP